VDRAQDNEHCCTVVERCLKDDVEGEERNERKEESRLSEANWVCCAVQS